MNSTGTSRLESLRRGASEAGRETVSAFLGGGQNEDPGGESDVAFDPETSSRAETLLRSIGVVATPPGSTPLRLESAFETAWRERLCEIRATDAQREVLAARLEIAPGRVTLAVTGDGFVASRGDERIGCWPSNAAFLADIAAAETLDDRQPDWLTLEPNEQGIVLTALRLFLDRCPNCDGELVGADAGTGTATAAELERPSATGTARTGADRGVSLECAYCGVMLIRAPYE